MGHYVTAVSWLNWRAEHEKKQLEVQQRYFKKIVKELEIL